MKTYKIYVTSDWDVCGWVKAISAIDALRKFYVHYVNGLNSGLRNLCYTAEIDETRNVTL